MNTIEMLTHLTDQGCRSIEPCSSLQRLLSPSSGKVTLRTANRILKNQTVQNFSKIPIKVLVKIPIIDHKNLVYKNTRYSYS